MMVVEENFDLKAGEPTLQRRKYFFPGELPVDAGINVPWAAGKYTLAEYRRIRAAAQYFYEELRGYSISTHSTTKGLRIKRIA